ncbi:MAG: DUF2723 domain-containing protein [bacterium]|nr:DUF2723 domain-containing protein [bacterium]
MKLSELKSPRHLSWILPTAIGLLVYLSTLCRTVYVGDAGEFSLDFKTLGIAHPPGYPLFTLIGRAFVMLTTFLKPAFSANLLAMLLAVAAIPAFYFLLQYSQRSQERGVASSYLAGLMSLLWAFSPLYWGQTVAVEVYGLNLVFTALILVLLFSEYPRKWFLISYLYGLALAHHPTALAVLPVLIYEFFTAPKNVRTCQYWRYAALFLLGLSVYLYLPTRASVDPVADWGHPATLGLFFNHITAAQYQHVAAFSLSNLLSSVKLFFSLLLGSWWWLGTLLAVWGALLGFRRKERLVIDAIILLVADLLLISFYRIPDIDAYYLPGLLACFLLICRAVYWLWDLLAAKNLGALVYAGGGLSVLLLILLNYSRLDRSADQLSYNYGKLILDTAVSGTIFTHDDNASFSSLYLRYAENYRPDVEIYDQAVRLKALVEKAGALSGHPVNDYEAAREIILQKAPGRKFLAKSHFPYDENWYKVQAKYFPSGILYSTSAVSIAAQLPQPTEDKIPDDFKSLQMLINIELSRAEDAMHNIPPMRDLADESVQRAQSYLADEPRGALHNQLGIALRHLGMLDAALGSYQKGLESARLNDSERKEIIFNISNIHKDRGNQFLASGQYQQSVNAFSKALEYDPQNSRLLYNVGAIYLKYLNRPDKGIPYFESYLELNPGDEQTRQLVEENKKK